MNANDRSLLLDCLGEYADQLGNDSCNDWTWPKKWSRQYRLDFLKRFNESKTQQTEDPLEYDPEFGPDNVSIVYFLIELLKEEVK